MFIDFGSLHYEMPSYNYRSLNGFVTDPHPIHFVLELTLCSREIIHNGERVCPRAMPMPKLFERDVRFYMFMFCWRRFFAVSVNVFGHSLGFLLVGGPLPRGPHLITIAQSIGCCWVSFLCLSLLSKTSCYKIVISGSPKTTDKWERVRNTATDSPVNVDGRLPPGLLSLSHYYTRTYTTYKLLYSYYVFVSASLHIHKIRFACGCGGRWTQVGPMATEEPGARMDLFKTGQNTIAFQHKLYSVDFVFHVMR